MIKKSILILLVISIVIFIVSLVIDTSNNPKVEGPINMALDTLLTGERPSPADHIKEDQIHVYDDRVVIEIENARWAGFVDTNSMDPFLDEDSNAIQIIPQSPDQIEIGDIISYESEMFNTVIIHRVIDIKEDEEGLYYLTKGDNNDEFDPEKVRFNMVRRLLVAIIY
ncbi:MAG: signal peptidase I [Nanoarchaeota archaeon]|nr:signal peptidase I [Nanoarchaeota archaeon]